MKNEITEEYYESIKNHMAKLNDEEIIEYRNKLMNENKLDDRLLEIINEVVLDRYCKNKGKLK